MTLAFFKKSNDFLTIYHFDDPTIKIEVKFPRGQWVWLQAEHNENYFSCFIEDKHKRVISRESTQIKHRSAPNYLTNSKYVLIAPNFYGYIKGI